MRVATSCSRAAPATLGPLLVSHGDHPRRGSHGGRILRDGVARHEQFALCDAADAPACSRGDRPAPIPARWHRPKPEAGQDLDDRRHHIGYHQPVFCRSRARNRGPHLWARQRLQHHALQHRRACRPGAHVSRCPARKEDRGPDHRPGRRKRALSRRAGRCGHAARLRRPLPGRRPGRCRGRRQSRRSLSAHPAFDRQRLSSDRRASAPRRRGNGLRAAGRLPAGAGGRRHRLRSGPGGDGEAVDRGGAPVRADLARSRGPSRSDLLRRECDVAGHGPGRRRPRPPMPARHRHRRLRRLSLGRVVLAPTVPRSHSPPMHWAARPSTFCSSGSSTDASGGRCAASSRASSSFATSAGAPANPASSIKAPVAPARGPRRASAPRRPGRGAHPAPRSR